MSKKKKSIVGKIGYCDNHTLGIKGTDGKPMQGGHYVYIREITGEKRDRCNVNVITSLEDKNGLYDFAKLRKAKYGMLYPIPKSDSDFSRWSAVNLDGNINNIPVKDIQEIGQKSMKKRHRFFVGKFTKKM